MRYMPQNIDATTKTIGLWCLARKGEKFITTMEVREEFNNVASNRVAAVLSRFEKEGYLTRISRGFYRVVPDNIMEFERRLKPSAKEIEIVPAIPVDAFTIDIRLKGNALNLNALLAEGVQQLEPDKFTELLDYLDEYAKSIQGMVKFARMNLESFTVYSVPTDVIAAARQFLKENFS